MVRIQVNSLEAFTQLPARGLPLLTKFWRAEHILANVRIILATELLPPWIPPPLAVLNMFDPFLCSYFRSCIYSILFI